MKKEKGFTLVATIIFLGIGVIFLNIMFAGQMSTLKYRKKRLQHIHKKIEVFNQTVLEANNESK
jgi:hypothetical protein